MEQMIALSKLRHSDSNVRKSGRTDIPQLAGDIEARGLLQNPCVTALKKPRGHYAVFAGCGPACKRDPVSGVIGV